MLFELLPRLTLCAGAILRWHLVGREIRNALLEAGPTRLLDVGCGRGEFTISAARNCPGIRSAIGVDEMETDAAGPFFRVPAALRGKVRLIQGRFSSAVVKDLGPFDAAVCVDVLEHVSEDEAFLADIAAVVGPAGKLILHVPASPQFHPIRRVGRKYKRLLESGLGQHVREGYTAERLRELLRATGWSVERLGPTFGPVAAFWTDLDMALWDLGLGGLPIRLALMPLTILGALAAPRCHPRRGIGWLVRAVRA
jgi:2-polyprenyl-3-methyl-5-hydroxy-6-metoxy-1,4-benzoquinol methylase